MTEKPGRLASALGAISGLVGLALLTAAGIALTGLVVHGYIWLFAWGWRLIG